MSFAPGDAAVLEGLSDGVDVTAPPVNADMYVWPAGIKLVARVANGSYVCPRGRIE